MDYTDPSRAIGPFKFFVPSGGKNHVAILGDVTLVALPCGHHAIIDTHNLGKIYDRKWSGRDQGSDKNPLFYVLTHSPTISLHRLIIGPPKTVTVDHINNDPLDNRLCNLRLATHAENMANRRKAKHGKSPFKGVTYDPGNGRTKALWRASLTVNGKRFRGPRRHCHYRAAMDYDALSIQHHGEFSRRNTKNLATLPNDEAS